MDVPKQLTPVRYSGASLQEYGSGGSDYITTRYIAEPESSLIASQQTLVNTYFASGALLTQNWQTNGCSLPAFQVISLNPGTF